MGIISYLSSSLPRSALCSHGCFSIYSVHSVIRICFSTKRVLEYNPPPAPASGGHDRRIILSSLFSILSPSSFLS
jgi:hypothetical protein